MTEYRLSDLLDISTLQRLADANFHTSGVPMSIIDSYDTSILVQAGWTDLCTQFHRANPCSHQRCVESDAAVVGRLAAGDVYRYKCQNGLWHVALPIIVAGKHLATMFLGQFLFDKEAPDRDYFIRQGREFGYDLDAYLAALDKMRVFTSEQVNYIIAYDKAIVLFISDLAEHSLGMMASKKSLSESEKKYRDLYDNAPDMYHSINREGVIIDCNETEARMLGYAKKEIIGKPIADFLTPESRKIYDREFATLKDHRSLSGLEREFVRKDGTAFPASMNVFIELDEHGDLMRTKTIARDISEPKRVERELRRSREDLRKLSAHIQSAREEERMAIAREIHDELGQVLSKLKLDIAWIKKRLSGGQALLVEKADKMSGLVDSTIRTVQKITSELRPGVLDYLGLSAAVEWQAKEFWEQTGIACHALISPDMSIADKDTSTAVFRIFQETLTNIIRHAGASRVDVALKEDDHTLVLEVRDNGTGIRQETVLSHESFGLMGMRERARFLGGRVTITGVPDRGTTVLVRIPLEGKEKR